MSSPGDVFAFMAPVAVGYIVSMVLIFVVSAITACINPILSAIVYRDRLQKVMD